MALPLDQMAIGVGDESIRPLVQAAMLNRCYLEYAITTGTAPLPAKRKELCTRVCTDPDRYVTQFAWMSLAVTTISTLDDYTSTVATSTINAGNWDMMADLLIRDAEVA